MSAQVFRPALIEIPAKIAADPCSQSDFNGASEESLLASLGSGDAGALEHLFDRYYGLVLRIASRILRDPGEAQDVAQEVFLQVYLGCHLYSPERGSVRTWFTIIACRRSLDRRRHLESRRFYTHVGLHLVKETPRPPGIAAPLVHRDARLDDALSHLTPRQRQTIELYCFEGLSLREIAARSGESFSNTRHHYYRGIESLRDHLIQPAANGVQGRTKEGL